MEKQSLGTCIWKGIKWMPRLIYFLLPDGKASSFIFAIAFSILLFPIWIGTAIIVMLINRLGGDTR